MTYILGIAAFYHDSAAALIKDGKIISAAQEERFTRKKHDSSYPFHAVEFVLKFSNINLSNVDHIIFYEKPFLKFERLLETYVAFAPKGFQSFSKAMPLWLKEKLFQKKLIFDCLKKHDKNFIDEKKILFSEHHLSHAASAFYPSPFKEAIVLTADGVGEWATTTVAICKNNKVEIKKELHFPHSLGLLYSAFTYYTGFKVNSGEYKLMGLAPYGKPKYTDIILDKLIDLKEDGTFMLDQKYFNYSTGLTMTNDKFDKLFGSKARKSESEKINQFHMDIAASIQFVTEKIMLMLARSLREEYKIKNLCLAGGVALNCVANGKILEEKIFDSIWVQPAAGDAGGSLGAALAFWYMSLDNKRKDIEKDSMQGSYLGNKYSETEIKSKFDEIGANYLSLSDKELIDKTAENLSNGKAVGWFQGRMEFGPRALGNRSIIGDPRSETMQKNLNLKVKFRESFRPFAPSVLREDASNWFEMESESPYMLFVAKVKKEKTIAMNKEQKKLFGIDLLNINRSEIPAVTHVDYTARIQTVSKENNKRFHDLLSKFKEKTNCPVLVNTSFNIRGEPIVNSPEDAFRCFMGTDLDILVVGNFYLEKSQQDSNLKTNYIKNFELD
ncbi:carbamoyltransferase [Candidatus Pelagibacter bacterium]|nr:carbamoyltransferase [Candidatus Pelagibacter bacterium]MDA8835161.1 carbamoyltransferase [Candidatus Pelagibacter bacterium]